jgi:PAS domain S-box-containing protein
VGWADDARSYLLDATATSALETSDPVVTSDLASETCDGGTARLDDLGLTSSLSVVIPGREQPFGVVVVHARRRRRFGEQDVHFVRAVANVLATAIERGRSEMALQLREQEVRALVDHAPDLIARFDRRHRFLYVNPASERATGVAAEAFIGRDVREAGLPEAQASIWEVALEQVFRTGREQTLEFATPTPLGERSYHARIVPELGPDGSVEFLLAISRDVTELRQAEQERAVLYREVLERERRLQELVSRMLLDREQDLRRAVEVERLTPRERQILPLLASGYSNREIAARLQLGTGTVKSYVERLLQKLGASSRAEAAARAATWGLLANQRP